MWLDRDLIGRTLVTTISYWLLIKLYMQITSDDYNMSWGYPFQLLSYFIHVVDLE